MIGQQTSVSSTTVVQAFTAVTALVLQLVGVYAMAATFGATITIELYALGALATLLQRRIVQRGAPCSSGE